MSNCQLYEPPTKKNKHYFMQTEYQNLSYRSEKSITNLLIAQMILLQDYTGSDLSNLAIGYWIACSCKQLRINLKDWQIWRLTDQVKRVQANGTQHVVNNNSQYSMFRVWSGLGLLRGLQQVHNAAYWTASIQRIYTLRLHTQEQQKLSWYFQDIP